MSTTTKPKLIRGVRRDCTCLRARHEHGTFGAYQMDRCGCDDCRAANAAYSREYKQARKLAENTPPAPITGQFIVTFPYHGGWSRDRLRRTADLATRQLATQQGVEITGPLTFRLDPTPAGGWLLIAQGTARTTRPATDVAKDAEHFAHQHQAIAPHLSAWADQHTREAAARSGLRRSRVSAHAGQGEGVAACA